MTAETKPTLLAYAYFAVVTLPPIVGAVVALVQDGWKPLGFGALCAAGLLVAFVVGSGVGDAHKARRRALRAENEVHSGPVTASTDGGKSWQAVRGATHSQVAVALWGERDLYLVSLESFVRAFDGARFETGMQALSYANARQALKRFTAPQPVVRSGLESESARADFTDPNVTRSPDPGHTGA